MKHCVRLLFLFSLLISTQAFGQKYLVNEAWNHLKFDELDKAKKCIDAARNSSQTKTSAKTWYYSGIIYQSIYRHKIYGALDTAALTTCIGFFQKCAALDVKNDYSADCQARLQNAWLIRGAEAYNQRNYADALTDFQEVYKVNPADSTALLYAAYSADYAGDQDLAFSYYSQLEKIGITEADPEQSNIYHELALLKMNAKHDTLGAIETIKEGRKKYPEALNLLKAEANVMLSTGQYSSAIELLEEVVSRTKSDPRAHFDLAIAFEAYANLLKMETGQDADKLMKQCRTDAEEHLRRSIDAKNDFFEGNYGLGSLYFNEAAELMQKANTMTDDKEFKVWKLQSEDKVLKALPYLEKALEIKPNDPSTLASLKQIYIRTGDSVKYTKVKKSLELLAK